MRSSTAATALSSLLLMASIGSLVPPAFAGSNERTSIILHAVRADVGQCDIPDPCAGGANVAIQQPGEPYVIYIVVRNYDNLLGVQFKVIWDLGWTYVSQADCLTDCPDCTRVSNQEIRYSAFFNTCQLGGASLVVGRIVAIPNQGCMRVVQSDDFGGTFTVTCDQTLESIPVEGWGAVCVGPGGGNTCGGPVAVESETWGAIKAQYAH
jgi:hypothetical protein